MDLLKWIQRERPGKLIEHPNRVEIEHVSGEHSTLWFNTGYECPDGLKGLDELFRKYDGADLFSSTFKIASIKEPKFRDGVQLTFTLDQIEAEFSKCDAALPGLAVPFMIQQGIGIYSVSDSGNVIYEWDTELDELSEEFPDLIAIFGQWLQAVEM